MALQDLPHRARVLYLTGLRVHMSYSTGIVGQVRMISLAGLCELLEVHPRYTSNNKTESVSKKMVRTALAQLTRAGLIQRLPAKKKYNVKPLVFKLVLASWDQSVCNSQGTGRGTGRGDGNIVSIASHSAAFAHSVVRGEDRGEGRGEGTHPVRLITIKKNSAVDNFSKARKNSLESFLPSKHTREACVAACCAVIDNEAIEAFKAHHKIAETESDDWGPHFVKWMIHRKRLLKNRSAKKKVAGQNSLGKISPLPMIIYVPGQKNTIFLSLM